MSRAREGIPGTQPCRCLQGPLERGSQDLQPGGLESQAQAGIMGGDEYRLRVGMGAFIKKKKARIKMPSRGQGALGGSCL